MPGRQPSPGGTPPGGCGGGGPAGRLGFAPAAAWVGSRCAGPRPPAKPRQVAGVVPRPVRGSRYSFFVKYLRFRTVQHRSDRATDTARERLPAASAVYRFPAWQSSDGVSVLAVMISRRSGRLSCAARGEGRRDDSHRRVEDPSGGCDGGGPAGLPGTAVRPPEPNRNSPAHLSGEEAAGSDRRNTPGS